MLFSNIFQLQVSLIEIIRLCSLEYNKCVYIISALVFAFLVTDIGSKHAEKYQRNVSSLQALKVQLHPDQCCYHACLTSYKSSNIESMPHRGSMNDENARKLLSTIVSDIVFPFSHGEIIFILFALCFLSFFLELARDIFLLFSILLVHDSMLC